MVNDERRTRASYAACFDSDIPVSSFVSAFGIRASSFRERRLIDEAARGHRAPIFFAADRCVFLLCGRDGLIHFGCELASHLLQSFAIHEFLFENQLFGELQ